MIDWGDTGSMLTGIGTIAGAIAIVTAALLGKAAVKDYNVEKRAEKRLDFAEQILASAYKMQSALKSIRSPFSSANDLQSSKEELAESGVLAKLRPEQEDRFIQANVFYQRIRGFADTFENAEGLLPYARGYFGETTYETLRSLIGKAHEVRMSASAYAQDRGANPDRTLRHEEVIWGIGDDDPTTTAINSSVSELETILLPEIREQDFNE